MHIRTTWPHANDVSCLYLLPLATLRTQRILRLGDHLRVYNHFLPASRLLFQLPSWCLTISRIGDWPISDHRTPALCGASNLLTAQYPAITNFALQRLSNPVMYTDDDILTRLRPIFVFNDDPTLCSTVTVRHNFSIAKSLCVWRLVLAVPTPTIATVLGITLDCSGDNRYYSTSRRSQMRWGATNHNVSWA